MTTAKKPQDRLTAKVEQTREDIHVEFHEEEYVITADAFDNIEIMELVEEEKYISAIKATIGLEQWNRFKNSVRDEDGKVTSAVFQEFIEVVFGALGN